jgi:hypothetical protein
VPLGAHGLALPLPFAQLPPANTTYNLTCVAAFASGASISTSAGLRRLPPNPHGGGATKLDRRTGALLRRAGDTGAWAPFLPWGFYTYYEDLASNASLVGTMADDGCVARGRGVVRRRAEARHAGIMSCTSSRRTTRPRA